MTDAISAFTDLMSDGLSADQLAEGVAALEAATTQMSAVGRLTLTTFTLDVQLELTSGLRRAFKGSGGVISQGGQIEIGGDVYTADAERLTSLTTNFTMLSDGSRLYFLDKDSKVLGHFAGTTSGRKFWSSPAIGGGHWFSVEAG